MTNIGQGHQHNGYSSGWNYNSAMNVRGGSINNGCGYNSSINGSYGNSYQTGQVLGSILNSVLNVGSQALMVGLSARATGGAGAAGAAGQSASAMATAQQTVLSFNNAKAELADEEKTLEDLEQRLANAKNDDAGTEIQNKEDDLNNISGDDANKAKIDAFNNAKADFTALKGLETKLNNIQAEIKKCDQVQKPSGNFTCSTISNLSADSDVASLTSARGSITSYYTGESTEPKDGFTGPHTREVPDGEGGTKTEEYYVPDKSQQAQDMALLDNMIQYATAQANKKQLESNQQNAIEAAKGQIKADSLKGNITPENIGQLVQDAEKTMNDAAQQTLNTDKGTNGSYGSLKAGDLGNERKSITKQKDQLAADKTDQGKKNLENEIKAQKQKVAAAKTKVNLAKTQLQQQKAQLEAMKTKMESIEKSQSDIEDVKVNKKDNRKAFWANYHKHKGNIASDAYKKDKAPIKQRLATNKQFISDNKSNIKTQQAELSSMGTQYTKGNLASINDTLKQINAALASLEE